MADLNDSIHYQQLARKARQLANTHHDRVVARTLRETAVKHDRLARQLKRKEASEGAETRELTSIFRFFRGK